MGAHKGRAWGGSEGAEATPTPLPLLPLLTPSPPSLSSLPLLTPSPPQARPEWRDNYLQYAALKNLIKEAHEDATGVSAAAFEPRTTSLTVTRAGGASKTADERFYELLEAEMSKINRFTVERVSELKKRLKALRAAVATRGGTANGDGAAADPEVATTDALVAEAKAVGDEFLALEKYVSWEGRTGWWWGGEREGVKSFGPTLPLFILPGQHQLPGLPQDRQEARQERAQRAVRPVLRVPHPQHAMGAGERKKGV